MIALRKLLCLLLSVIDLIIFQTGGEPKLMKEADVTITVNPFVEYQDLNGFGTSACWWAQLTDANDEYADEVARLLYSKEGLGLNIYRYNIGAGEKDNPNSRISGSRATESFYYYNEAKGQYEYDFNRDAAAQAMLDKCLAYGCIDTVVLFANSPHYSMTKTGYATGGYTENESNLPPENYEAYADYFLTITEYFLEKGIPVKYISPVNEPQWAWSGGWVGQEGCHYEPDEVIALFKVFAKKMKERNIDVQLMGPESGTLDDARYDNYVTSDYFSRLYNDEDIKDVLGSLAYHSYWCDDPGESWRKKDLGELVNEKYSVINVDMTEWCELPCAHSINDFDGALLMARVILQDLAYSNANSWTAWVGVNNYGIGEDGEKYSDAMLVSNEEFSELYTGVRYYAMAHFSKYIPAGSTRISAKFDVTKERFVPLNMTAFKTPEGKIVVVIVNEEEIERNVYFDFILGNMQVITSTADSQFKTVYSGRAKSKVNIPAKSITTVVYG